VVVNQIEIDRRNGVVGTDERNLFGARKVTEIEEAELAKGDKDSTGTSVLTGVIWPLALGGAVRVGLRFNARNR